MFHIETKNLKESEFAMITILKNGNVVTMETESVLHKTDIMIEDGRIIEIGVDLESDGSKIIDCTDYYITPGLFDMHSHILSSDMFNLYLSNGVTAIRNMWGAPLMKEWENDIKNGTLLGPSIFSTNPLTDGLEFWKGAVIIKTEQDVLNCVKDAVTQDYKYIKTYPDIPRDLFILLMNEAKKADIKVVGHGNRNVSPKELADLGYYSLEHATLLPKDPEDVKYLAESGMWHCPTFVVCWGLVKSAQQDDNLTSMEFYEYVNKREQKDWQEIIEFLRKSPRMKTINMEEQIDLAKVFAKHSDKILLGTDNTNPGSITGFGIHEELGFLVRHLEFTPYQAIKAGTWNAAKNLEMLDDYGSVSAGKVADLLVVKDNPLKDVGNMKNIEYVITKGKVLTKDNLQQMLDEVFNMSPDEIVFAFDNEILG
jgi:imidazolonepropionase-like amidohydrolase